MSASEEWRAPPVPADHQLIHDEPGRIVRHIKPDGADGPMVDSTAYYLRVTRAPYGPYWLRVRHGSGDEAWSLGHEANTVRALAQLASDDRYCVLRTMMHTLHAAERVAQEQSAMSYKQAFVDGRLKKRKTRGQATARVWIEAAPL